MKLYTFSLSVLTILVFTGCSSGVHEAEPGPAKAFILYSINPRTWMIPPEKKKAMDLLYGFQILGKIKIENEKDREKLLNSLIVGISEHNDPPTACKFSPRHGLKVVHNKKTVDYIICFQCGDIQVYENGTKVRDELTTRSPQPVFNSFLKAKNIPIAK